MNRSQSLIEYAIKQALRQQLEADVLRLMRREAKLVLEIQKLRCQLCQKDTWCNP